MCDCRVLFHWESQGRLEGCPVACVVNCDGECRAVLVAVRFAPSLARLGCLPCCPNGNLFDSIVKILLENDSAKLFLREYVEGGLPGGRGASGSGNAYAWPRMGASAL